MKEKSKSFYLKIFILGIIVVIFFIIILVIVIKDDINKDELLEDKINEELSYIDNSIISILNSVNNISVNNYILETKENLNKNIKKSKVNEINESNEDKSNTDDSKEESKNEEDEKESSSSSKDQSNSDENNVIYEMKRSGVLTGKDTDWNEVQNSIENIYPIWITMEIDLDKKNINSDDINKVNDILDILIIDAKDKNKVTVVKNLGELYNTIEIIVNESSNNKILINKYKLKSNIVKTYIDIEEDNWQDARNQIDNINKAYNELKESNNLEENQIEEYNLIKLKKLIEDLVMSLNKENKYIYYIKYKSLIEEINLI